VTISATSSARRVSRRGGSIRELRLLAIVGVMAALIGLILIPISKVSETERVSASETQTVAQSLCPPPIVTPLDQGDCHIRLIDYSPNITADARIAVYNQNNSVVYQSSMFEEEEPSLVRHVYNFTVTDSGIYNVTLENAGVFFVKIELTTTTLENLIVYPFDSLLYSGLIVAATGLGVICVCLTRALWG
jgi:hypothetical protein